LYDHYASDHHVPALKKEEIVCPFCGKCVKFNRVESHVSFWHTAPREFAQAGGTMYYIKVESKDNSEAGNLERNS
jgi:hypothetical protein